MDPFDDASWDSVFAYMDRKEKFIHLQTLLRKHAYLFVDPPALLGQVQVEELRTLYLQLKEYDGAYTALLPHGTFEKGMFTASALGMSAALLHTCTSILSTPTRTLGSSLEERIGTKAAKTLEYSLEALSIVAGAYVVGKFLGKKALAGYTGSLAVMGASGVYNGYIKKRLETLNNAKETILNLQRQYVN